MQRRHPALRLCVLALQARRFQEHSSFHHLAEAARKVQGVDGRAARTEGRVLLRQTKGQLEKALQSGLTPQAWHDVLSVYHRVGKKADAITLLKYAMDQQPPLRPLVLTCIMLLPSCYSTEPDLAPRLLSTVVERSTLPREVLQAYTGLIRGYADKGEERLAVTALREVQQKGYAVDVPICNAALKACCTPASGRVVMQLMEEEQLEPNARTYSALIRLEGSNVAAAEVIYQEAVEAKGLACTDELHLSMVAAYVAAGDLRGALEAAVRAVDTGHNITIEVVTQLLRVVLRRAAESKGSSPFKEYTPLVLKDIAERVFLLAEIQEVARSTHVGTLFDIYKQMGDAEAAHSLWQRVLRSGVALPRTYGPVMVWLVCGYHSSVPVNGVSKRWRGGAALWGTKMSSAAKDAGVAFVDNTPCVFCLLPCSVHQQGARQSGSSSTDTNTLRRMQRSTKKRKLLPSSICLGVPISWRSLCNSHGWVGV